MALGGQVFDVLGKLQFEGKSLRDLMIQAIRYGERPEVKAYLSTVLDQALDRSHLQNLLEERALAHDVMDLSRVQRIREDMERADARRLQPRYIESSSTKPSGAWAAQPSSARPDVTRLRMSRRRFAIETASSALASRCSHATNVSPSRRRWSRRRGSRWPRLSAPVIRCSTQ